MYIKFWRQFSNAVTVSWRVRAHCFGARCVAAILSLSSMCKVIKDQSTHVFVVALSLQYVARLFDGGEFFESCHHTNEYKSWVTSNLTTLLRYNSAFQTKHQANDKTREVERHRYNNKGWRSVRWFSANAISDPVKRIRKRIPTDFFLLA